MKRSIIDLVNEKMINFGTYLIEDRALLDVRDGLKPVQRRVLFNMFDKGYTPDKPHKKSASITGGTIADFHPHSQTSVYDTLARLSQKFRQQVLFTDPQGNWGHLDGSPVAAERYTENRLSKIAMDLLFDDIRNNAVDMVNNFSGELKEPTVLPAKVPFALLNPQSGIAYGFTSSTVSYNFNEVIDTILGLLDDTKTEEDVYKLVPDFPTGGTIVMPLDEIINENKTSKGCFLVKGTIIKDNIEKTLTITELPYGVTTSKVITSLIELCKNEPNNPMVATILDIKELPDLDNPKIVVYTNNKNLDMLEEFLYKRVKGLKEKQYVNFAGLTEGNNCKKLAEYNIYGMLVTWLDFRYKCKKRVLINELTSVSTRINLLNGILIALANIDLVISIVKSTNGLQETISELSKALSIPEIQASYIAELKIYRLNQMSIQTTKEDIAKLELRKKEIIKILNEDLITDLIYTELQEINEKYKFPRKTKFVDATESSSLLTAEPLAEEDGTKFYVGISNKMTLVKSTKPLTNKYIKSGEYTNSDIICFLTENGQMYTTRISEIVGEKSVNSYTNKNDVEMILFKEEIDAMKYLLVVSKETTKIKRIAKADLFDVNHGNISTDQNTKFIYQNIINDNDIILLNEAGNCIRLEQNEIPAIKRLTDGAKTSRYKITDCAMLETGLVTILTDSGKIKFVDLFDAEDGFSPTKRSYNATGKMIISIDDGEKAIKIFEIPEEFSKLIIKNDKEQLTIEADKISIARRQTKGKSIFKSNFNPRFITFTIV